MARICLKANGSREFSVTAHARAAKAVLRRDIRSVLRWGAGRHGRSSVNGSYGGGDILPPQRQSDPLLTARRVLGKASSFCVPSRDTREAQSEYLF